MNSSARPTLCTLRCGAVKATAEAASLCSGLDRGPRYGCVLDMRRMSSSHVSHGRAPSLRPSDPPSPEPQLTMKLGQRGTPNRALSLEKASSIVDEKGAPARSQSDRNRAGGGPILHVIGARQTEDRVLDSRALLVGTGSVTMRLAIHSHTLNRLSKRA